MEKQDDALAEVLSPRPPATQDDVLNLARKIAAETGVSIAEAAAEAEQRLMPQVELVRTEYDVRLVVPKKVAVWIDEVFAAVPGASLEERLAAYLVQHLKRLRATNRAAARNQGGEIGKAALSGSAFARAYKGDGV